MIGTHECGHAVFQRGRVDGLHHRRALAEEVAKHEAKRCGAGAELALLLDLVQQGGQLGVEDETAWRVGLPCGGQIKVFLERLEKPDGLPLLTRAIEAGTKRSGLVLRTHLEDGRREVFERKDAHTDEEVRKRFESGESTLMESSSGEVFLHALVPRARILIIGATHIGQILAQLVTLAGYEVLVIDPRTAFAAEGRFPGIRLDTQWPQEAIPRIGLDPYTAVVALAHVGHIDDEALKLAVRSECFYVGALGSRRNHAKRTERLLAAGFTPVEIARIKCPIGLDIGAQSPAEIAIRYEEIGWLMRYT